METLQALHIDPSTLTNSWTALVKLNNGQKISIWWTAWPSTKSTVSEIVSISSDYPRHTINGKFSI